MDKELAREDLAPRFDPERWTFLREECYGESRQPYRFTGHGPAGYGCAYESGAAVRAYETGRIVLNVRVADCSPHARECTSKQLGPVDIDLARSLIREHKWVTPDGKKIVKAALNIVRNIVLCERGRSVGTIRRPEYAALFDKRTRRLYSLADAREVEWRDRFDTDPAISYTRGVAWAVAHKDRKRARALQAQLDTLRAVAEHRGMVEEWDSEDHKSRDAFQSETKQAIDQLCRRFGRDISIGFTNNDARATPPLTTAQTGYNVIARNFPELAAEHNDTLLRVLWLATRRKASVAIGGDNYYIGTDGNRIEQDIVQLHAATHAIPVHCGTGG